MEAEVFLTSHGSWKNFGELEESVNLDELNLLLKTSREMRKDDQRFYAAFKGVDLDKEDSQTTEEAFQRVQQRAQARLRGVSVEEIERMSDGEMFGLEFEVEE